MMECVCCATEYDALSVEEIAEIAFALRGYHINEGDYGGLVVRVESCPCVCADGYSTCYTLSVSVSAAFGTEKAYPVYMRREAPTAKNRNALVALGREIKEAIEALQGDSVAFLCPPK